MKYKIFSNEAQVVVGSEGAMLNSLYCDGREYLWQGDELHWSGQAPVCFPINGVIPDNKGTAFGKPCFMKRHGVARISPFSVLEQHKNSITFVQHSSEDTKKLFPFDYELRIKYTVVGKTVTTEYTVINTGSEKFPFVIGGHPAFNCPLNSDEHFEDYKVIFDKPIKKAYLRPDHHTGLVDVDRRYDLEDNTAISLRHDLFEEKDAMIFDSVAPKTATLMGPNGNGVRIEYQDMNNLLVWSACDNADFVALEPWTGIANCSDETDEIEKKRGMTVLEPDDEASFKFKITLI